MPKIEVLYDFAFPNINKENVMQEEDKTLHFEDAKQLNAFLVVNNLRPHAIGGEDSLMVAVSNDEEPNVYGRIHII